MKCIEGEYGNICKEGGFFSSKTIIQSDGDSSYKFKLQDIKKLLRTYNRSEYRQNNLYGRIAEKDNPNRSYKVWFNFVAQKDAVEYPIIIGCKVYSKETVERAIKAFL